jgi:DNA-binding ferritin-like protein
MKQLTTLFRASQFLAQEFHHNTAGDTFQQDHKTFEAQYEAYADAYDHLAERMIGTEVLFAEARLNLSAATMSANIKRMAGAKAMFQVLLDMEGLIRTEAAACSSALTLGSQNLVAQLADDSEARCYQLRKRLGL